jgi:hypothetical protein
MSQTHLFHIRPLIFMFGTLILLAGCASHPRYGASPRKKKGCDCPKWTAVPKSQNNEYRVEHVAPNHDLVTFTHAAHH